MKILRLNIILFVVILCFAAACRADKLSPEDIREPAVAGQFYPLSASRLQLAIEKYLQDAMVVSIRKPVAMIVPHAGYIFSGQICADGFKQAGNHHFDVVVILGTNHTDPDFHKVSLYSGSGFRTPLGVVSVDKEIISSLAAENRQDCVLDKSVHTSEHSVEVIVPFVQVVFPKAKIVPIIVGASDPQMYARFGRSLADVIRNKNALVIASSDLSHYPSAKDAKVVDQETLTAITSLDTAVFQKALLKNQGRGIPNLHTSACGDAPIMAVMIAAKALGATRGTIISYANSADTSVGDGSRVVGYGAVALTADQTAKPLTSSVFATPASSSFPLDAGDKKMLLSFARETLSRLFLTETAPLPRTTNVKLYQPSGAFVTLKKNGELRGCIGQMTGDEPLIKIVGAMAIQAAFNDRRFQPLTADELKETEIEISVLTPLRRVSGFRDIVVGRDGVFLLKEGRSAVFLPQVAPEQGWSRDEMLDHLCKKAGLETDCWKKDAQFSIFQAIVFRESEYKLP